MFSSKKTYSLRGSRSILKHACSMYKKRKDKLSFDTQKEFETHFVALDNALLSKQKEEADFHARKIERMSEIYLKKTFFESTIELIGAILFALVVASVVRQAWFELYEIPTGSMRPTFEEQDRLTVSKTAFGINIPFLTKHFYFDEKLIQRGGVVIFSGDQIDLPDTDTKYFWIFPAKKRYIKRILGKPGDSLYFYGGKIYGVDKNGEMITDFENAPWMEGLEHIPFLTFDGKVQSGEGNQIIFKQMNQPIARVTGNEYEGNVSELFVDGKWVKDSIKKPDDSLSYSDFLGMRNFAMARLLTKEEMEKLKLPIPPSAKNNKLFLELAHHPSLTYPEPSFDRQSLNNHTIVGLEKSIIPLDDEAIESILKNMYTARFVVKNNHVTRYSADKSQFSSYSPKFAGIPDGTYEFYYGKGWSVGFGGILSALPDNHPLYDKSPKNVQKLFNLGIDLITLMSPSHHNSLFPHRYAYFRDGSLYLMGAEILNKNSPTLKKFVKAEKLKEKNGTPSKPYYAFKDYGAPFKEGKIDIDFIKKYGVTIPDRHYLALGDNHAMSADSRIFGFVPEQNLEGVPSLIIWPYGERLGAPVQKPYPLITLPRVIIWALAAIILGIAYYLHRQKIKKPIFKK